MLSTRSRSPSRRWSMRLLAVVIGLLPVVAVEGVLRILDLPRRAPAIDPFLDLHNLRPLFVAAEDGTHLEIGSERQHLFQPARFVHPKPPGMYRIFALGGSTTQGEPFSTPTAFPEWMRLNLQAAAPDQQIETINCGGLSYASYRVLAILREVLRYEPDLIVIYTGHNEYLEHRSYAGYHQRSFADYSRGWLSQLRLVQVLRNDGPATRPSPANRTELEPEVDALLDYQAGLQDYQRGAAWYRPIPEHFRWNLQRMVEACQEAKVPLVLVRPVSNLLDTPPFKSEFAPELSESERGEIETEWQAALEQDHDPAARLPHLQRVLSLDPGFADAQFLMGRLYYELGDYALARQHLVRAKDRDVCPLRAPSAIETAVEEVCEQSGVPWLDAGELFAARSPHGIVGDRWLVDHIHPSVEGHQLLGEELAELLWNRGLATRQTGSRFALRRRELYSDHLSELGEAYFHRGQQRLQGLLLWTQGRANKIRPSSN